MSGYVRASLTLQIELRTEISPDSLCDCLTHSSHRLLLSLPSPNLPPPLPSLPFLLNPHNRTAAHCLPPAPHRLSHTALPTSRHSTAAVTCTRSTVNMSGQVRASHLLVKHQGSRKSVASSTRHTAAIHPSAHPCTSHRFTSHHTTPASAHISPPQYLYR